jgi:adenine phosphoribosyltransferase
VKRYELLLVGLTRSLPIVKVSPGLEIASFVMLGDTELVSRCARALYEHPSMPRDVDVVVCPEAKTIPLAQSLCELLRVDYVVARKSVKPYMVDPIVETTVSMTTTEVQKLVIDGTDLPKLVDRKVLVLDDVFSTMGTLRSLEKLLSKTGCTITGRACVLVEGDAYEREKNEIVYLGILPIFRTN